MYKKRMARSLFTCALSVVGIIIIFGIMFYKNGYIQISSFFTRRAEICRHAGVKRAVAQRL